MPPEERPRERLLRVGARNLRDAELLAIMLRTGTRAASALVLADCLLREYRDFRGLAAATVDDIKGLKGVGLAKAIEIVACLEIGRRLARQTQRDEPYIRSPQDVWHEVGGALRDSRQEEFVVLLLDTRSRVMKRATVSVGSLDTSIVHPREVFREAVNASAANVIVAHNHPSGDPTPSGEDRQVTARLVEAGRVLGIEVLDHIVIGRDRWVSLRQEGLM